MKIESLKTKTESLTRILVAVAALLGALTFLRVGSFLNSSRAMAMAGPPDPSTTDGRELQTALAQTRASADEIKKMNLFAPGAGRQYPISEVMGILGHEALIGDRWYQVGDSVGEARIVAIEATKVRVVWNGQEKEFSPIGAAGGPDGRSNRPASAGRRQGAGGPGKVVIANATGGPNPATSGFSGGKKNRELWMKASPEEKQRLRDELHRKSGRKNR
jgi:hypothetical protein